jgi:hypothetical protein
MNAYGTTIAGRYATSAASGAMRAKRVSPSSERRERATTERTITPPVQAD